jgi:hypothetical protein
MSTHVTPQSPNTPPEGQLSNISRSNNNVTTVSINSSNTNGQPQSNNVLNAHSNALNNNTTAVSVASTPQSVINTSSTHKNLTEKERLQDERDYKKLYEELLGEVDKVRRDMSIKEQEWNRTKRQQLRKLSEYEEEVKLLAQLETDNQRLKDENGALIRVISKLSK